MLQMNMRKKTNLPHLQWPTSFFLWSEGERGELQKRHHRHIVKCRDQATCRSIPWPRNLRIHAVWVFSLALLTGPVPVDEHDSWLQRRLRPANQDVDIANIAVNKAFVVQANKIGCYLTPSRFNCRVLPQITKCHIVRGCIFHDDHKPAINVVDSVEFWGKTKVEGDFMGVLGVAPTELDAQACGLFTSEVSAKDPLVLDYFVIREIMLTTIGLEKVAEGEIGSRPRLVGKDGGVEGAQISQSQTEGGNRTLSGFQVLFICRVHMQRYTSEVLNDRFICVHRDSDS